MNQEVQKLFDSLKTDRELDLAYAAVSRSTQAESALAMVDFAKSRGFDFSPEEATAWLAAFFSSVSDSELRARIQRCRLHHANDWAAFIALEREFKVQLPDEEWLGTPWMID